MKRFGYLLVLPLLVALLAFADSALLAARDALSVWYRSVLPALLPFLIGCALMEKLLPNAAALTRRARSVALISGALCGYPAGAKLLGSLVAAGGMSQKRAQTMALFCNLPSPVFLVSIIACGLFGCKTFFLPLAAGCYLPPLVWLLFFLRKKDHPSPPAARQPGRLLSVPEAVTAAITDGVMAILRICGCLVTGYVLTALIEQSGVFGLMPGAQLQQAARAVTAGCLEMTAGCVGIRETAISARWQLALCTFFVVSGGLSVFLQTCCFLPLEKPLRYLAGKLLLGGVGAAVCYLMYPLCASGAAAVLSQQAERIRINAVSAGALLLCAGIASVFVLLIAVIGSGGRRDQSQ